MYNDNGYVVGNVILDNIDHDKVGHYAQTWTMDEDYAEIDDYLKEVEKASGVAFIYIVTINEDHTLRYVFDTTGTPIGATDPIPAHFDDAWEAYTTGTRPKSYMVRRSPKYGYLTSSLLPIIDSQGNVVAMLAVDVWMEVIIGTLNQYILRMILISLGALAVFGVAYWYIMRPADADSRQRHGVRAE